MSDMAEKSALTVDSNSDPNQMSYSESPTVQDESDTNSPMAPESNPDTPNGGMLSPKGSNALETAESLQKQLLFDDSPAFPFSNTRRFIYRCLVQRQTTFSIKTRGLLIFDDYAILVKNAPGQKMNVRKVMSLMSLRVEPPKKDDKKRTLLELEYIMDKTKASDKIFIGCEDAEARAELLHVLALAITEAMQRSGVRSPDAHSRVKGTAFAAVLLDDGARLEEIMAAGTSANVLDTMGQPLLSVALQAGKFGLASLLLQRGAAPNAAAVSACGLLADDTYTAENSIAPLARTPAAGERCTRLLHLACGALAGDAVKLLLSRGADVHALDDRGLTPLACAARAVMPAYRQDEAEAGEAIAGGCGVSLAAGPAAAWAGSALEGLSGRAQQRLAGEVVKALADRGADVDEADSAGKTLLMHAAHKDSVPLVTALVDARAGMSTMCAAGLTALHYAAKSAATDAARVLLQHGAGANLRDSQGNTPLHLCTDLPTARVLAEHGARPELLNMYKRPCLEHFRQGGDASYVDSALDEALARWRASGPTPGDALEEEWMPDKSSPVCLLCVSEFSLFVRRHHCRRCGVLCDKACSQKQVAGDGGKLSRVCDCCYNELRYRAAKASATVTHVAVARSPRAAAAGTVFAQNAERAQERGKALRAMNSKADAYQSEGRTFRSMTAQLSKQYSNGQ